MVQFGLVVGSWSVIVCFWSILFRRYRRTHYAVEYERIKFYNRMIAWQAHQTVLISANHIHDQQVRWQNQNRISNIAISVVVWIKNGMPIMWIRDLNQNSGIDRTSGHLMCWSIANCSIVCVCGLKQIFNIEKEKIEVDRVWRNSCLFVHSLSSLSLNILAGIMNRYSYNVCTWICIRIVSSEMVQK